MGTTTLMQGKNMEEISQTVMNVRRAMLKFWRTTPGMGSERSVALGQLNLLMIKAQSEKGYPKEGRMVRGKKMDIYRPMRGLEKRTLEIMEGVMLDGQSERYYNGRWHETI